MEKLEREQEYNRKNILVLQGIHLDPDSKKIPVVHPRLLEMDFYNENATQIDTYIPPEEPFIIQPKLGKLVSYKDIFWLVKKYKFICLSGFPGSGKTTISKRLEKDLTDYICLRICFHDINYSPETKLTLQELLLNRLYPQLSNETCSYAFKYFRENNEKLVIILDGYDKVNWTIEENPTHQSLDAELPISELISKLVRKQFFPRACIILTTRPHRLMGNPKGLRPDYTLLLQDLDPKDMHSLLVAFAGSDAQKISEVLNERAPLLKGLCLNPLFLQLFIGASRKYLGNSSEMLTATRIFSAVLSSMRWSDNVSHPNIDMIGRQLGRLAFKATKNHKVVVTVKDLHNEELKIEDVQDLIIPFDRSQTIKDYNENTKLSFFHQTLQEFFAAKYLMSDMPVSEFKIFLREELFAIKWFMVRSYLCGLLVDINRDECENFDLLISTLRIYFFFKFLVAQNSILRPILSKIFGLSNKESKYFV